jgi:hypothetical protein
VDYRLAFTFTMHALPRFVNEHMLALACTKQQPAQRSESGPERKTHNCVDSTVVAGL